jgi:hypothetical protein
MTRLFRLLFARRASASDAARTLSARAAAQRAETCATERQAVRAKALEMARGMNRADLVARFK